MLLIVTIDVNKTGYQWRMAPTDIGHAQTIYGYCRRWRLPGVWERVLDTLRPWKRQRHGRLPKLATYCACHTGNHVEDVAYISLDFGQNVIAHFHVNWLSPVKVRQMIFGGSDRMVIFNNLEPSEKLRIYDRGIEVKADNHEGIYNLLVYYRSGDIRAPALDGTEALRVEVEPCLDCIERGAQPLTDGEDGLRVVRILEAAQMSIKAGGKRVAI